MPEQNTALRPYTIVVGVDFSDTATLALGEALRLASKRAPAEVHAVHVSPPMPPGAVGIGAAIGNGVGLADRDGINEQLREHANRALGVLAEEGTEVGSLRLVAHTAVGSAAEAIAQLASDLEADLVVVGTHGRRGLQRMFLGSVAEVVVRLAPSPVLVTRPKVAGDQDLPQIAPPCPMCVETRRTTAGKELWCSQHSERHQRRHTYHFVDRNAAARPNMPLFIRGR